MSGVVSAAGFVARSSIRAHARRGKRVCGDPPVQLGPLLAGEVGAGGGAGGDLLLVQLPGGGQWPDPVVQVVGGPHPHPTLVGEDPAGHCDVVSDELLDLARFGEPSGDGVGGEFPGEFADLFRTGALFFKASRWTTGR